MSEFLVEAYVSRGVAPVDEQRLREGSPVVRFVRSIFVPEDETCFYLFEAASIEEVREVVQRAGMQVERISEATAPGGGQDNRPNQPS